MVVMAWVLAAFSPVLASASEAEIAERIKKVGVVCVEGQDCGTATSAITVAAAGGSGGAKANYDKTCATCHAIGIANAPKFGDKEAWAPLLAKGMDVLYTNSIVGIPPGMPAKGMCFTCSEDDIKAIVDYMAEAAQ